MPLILPQPVRKDHSPKREPRENHKGCSLNCIAVTLIQLLLAQVPSCCSVYLKQAAQLSKMVQKFHGPFSKFHFSTD